MWNITLSRLAIFAFRFPKVIKILKRIMRHFPNLEVKIRANVSSSVGKSANTVIVEHDLEIQREMLSPLALEIFNKLDRRR